MELGRFFSFSSKVHLHELQFSIAVRNCHWVRKKFVCRNGKSATDCKFAISFLPNIPFLQVFWFFCNWVLQLVCKWGPLPRRFPLIILRGGPALKNILKSDWIWFPISKVGCEYLHKNFAPYFSLFFLDFSNLEKRAICTRCADPNAEKSHVHLQKSFFRIVKKLQSSGRMCN